MVISTVMRNIIDTRVLVICAIGRYKIVKCHGARTYLCGAGFLAWKLDGVSGWRTSIDAASTCLSRLIYVEFGVIYGGVETFVFASANAASLVKRKGWRLSFCGRLCILSQPAACLAVQRVSSCMNACRVEMAVQELCDDEEVERRCGRWGMVL